MKIIALIPARLQSTRFNEKLLKPLGNTSVIGCTYKNVLASGLFDEVAVVTDSDLIAEEIDNIGGLVYRNEKSHESGTDRIAEFMNVYNEDDIIINVQGDEPFLAHDMLRQLIDLMTSKSDQMMVGTLMHRLGNMNDVMNPNHVKVVRSEDGRALFFSRSPIPYNRDPQNEVTYYKHIGIYAFTPLALKTFTESAVSPLENIEKLENLRFLELGIPVYIEETVHSTIGIDTEEDWIKAQEFIK